MRSFSSEKRPLAYFWEPSIFKYLVPLALLCAAPAFAQTIPVPVATLVPATWRTHIEVPATLAAQHTATLAPALGGIVTGVMFESGQQVAAGQVLVQLENGPQQAQYALDQARLEQALRDLARTQKLMTISGASRSALEQAQATVAEGRAQLALDQANLAQLQITAPFAGTMGIRNLDPGDYAPAGAAIATITASGPLRVLFSVPQTESGGLAPGAPFTLTIPTSGGASFTASGELTALSPAQDTATDARAVEGRVTGDAANLLPGMSGIVDIATGAPLPAFSVPSTALNDSTLGPYLFVLTPAKTDDTLSTVYVSIYGSQGDTTLVSPGGLAAGEQIVALGGFKLTDGASVTPESP